MNRLILLALFALVSFGTSAAATWWLTKGASESTDVAAVDESPVTGVSDDIGVRTPLAAPLSDGQAGPPETLTPTPATEPGLPVAVRPRPMSVEEILRYGMGLNQREEAIRLREEELDAENLQARLVLADLRGEQEAIDGLRAHVQSQLEAADDVLRRIEEARSGLSDARSQAEQDLRNAQQAQIRVDEQQRENIKQTASWLQAMDPEKAADVLREMANDGRLERGVLLLAQLEEREVAKILSALDEASLVDEIIDRFQDLQRPEKTLRTTR